MTFGPKPVGLADPISGDIVDIVDSTTTTTTTSTASGEENTRNGIVYVNGMARAIVAVGGWQKFCLAISRMSAFSMYPPLIIVFFTKMKALQTFLAATPLSIHCDMLHRGHDYHTYAGAYIVFDVWIHALFHLLRWADQENLDLVWTTRVGRSGVCALMVIPLIGVPMMYCKAQLSYEVRKGLHYCFYVFGIALCFHVPTSALPNGGFIVPVLGTCIVMYTLDALWVYIFMTEKIETTTFHVLSSGVRISMPVSSRFQKRVGINHNNNNGSSSTSSSRRGGRGGGVAGFAYLNIPWINPHQWHPFSLFEDPHDPSIQQMFLLKNGDWTNAVHAALEDRRSATRRACWIRGPFFASPYSHNACLYDHQILVASGIGITPALAAIRALGESRRMNLVWAVRDAEMLEFFLKHMYLNHDGWNLIFYTGKTPLPKSIQEELLGSSSSNGNNNGERNVKLVHGRPQLHHLIPNIIYGNESDSPSFRLWEESEEQTRVVKGLEDHVLASWGMMYCGGSPDVLSALREISMEFHVDLHVDSFAW